MIEFTVSIILIANLIICCGNVNAAKRESTPDLRPVPGCILNHNNKITVNPTPVKISQSGNEKLNISAGFNIISVPEELSKSLKYFKISQSGIPLHITYNAATADSLDIEQKSGAYRLSISPDNVSITGFDECGAFYGINTFRQIVESAQKNGGEMPVLEINDYPTFKYRGVVEGFYGRPWSHKTRLSILDFMGRHKMNSYVYGPKDDPYHRTPNWRQPYPEEEGKKIKELVERATQNHIDFVWAIHPGGDIRWNKADYDSLLNKFSAMYELGVRQFAIFFDDIKGNGTDSRKQTEMLNNIINDFVKKKVGVKNLIVCPTDYNQGWANPSEQGQLAIYGKELDPAIDVFWTGKVVCGDIDPASMEFVNSRIKRPALVWWNFPVSDYCRHNLLMGPVYGLDTTLDGSSMAGIESNPMENGEASKSAIYGVADYAWNASAYNPLDNWTRSFSEIMPGAPDAYGTFAIHSCDPPKNYRRNESWNIETFRYDDYTVEQFENLRREFTKIKNAPDVMVNNGGNMPLVVEIAPWLVEFANLGERGLRALDLIKIYESNDKEKFREAYRALKTINDIQNPGYLNYRSGTLKLQPFIDSIITDLKTAYDN